MNKIIGMLLGVIIAGSTGAMDRVITAKELIAAARNENKDPLMALIEARADVNKAHKKGWTALMEAASRGRIHHLEALISAGADVDQPNKYGRTALHGAAGQGRLNCVQSLIAAKATVNHQIFDSGIALIEASRGGHLDCVNALIAANADVNEKQLDGSTSLDIAIRSGHIDCVNALIRAHAHVGKEELWEADFANHPPIAERLVEVLLHHPSQLQMASIAALLRRATKHQVCKDHKKLILEAFKEQMYWYNRSNRANFEQSVAGEAVTALPGLPVAGSIKAQLLEKYGPQK